MKPLSLQVSKLSSPKTIKPLSLQAFKLLNSYVLTSSWFAKDLRGPGLKNNGGLVRDLNPGPLAP